MSVFSAFYFDKSDSETLDQARLTCQSKNKELAVLNSAEDLQDAIAYIIKSGYVNSNPNKNCYLLDIYNRRKFRAYRTIFIICSCVFTK